MIIIMIIIKTYKVKKIFNDFPDISGKIRINFGKFPEISEVTILVAAPLVEVIEIPRSE